MCFLPSFLGLYPCTSQYVVGASACPGLAMSAGAGAAVAVVSMVKKVEADARSSASAISWRLHLAHRFISDRTRRSHTIPKRAMIGFVMANAGTWPQSDPLHIPSTESPHQHCTYTLSHQHYPLGVDNILCKNFSQVVNYHSKGKNALWE